MSADLSALTDAHCHLTDPRFFPRADAIIEASAEAGVRRFVLGGVEPGEWDRQLELKRRHPERVRMSWGLHPWWVNDATEEQIQLGLARMRMEAFEYDAVGELGLDQIDGKHAATGDKQARVFREQLVIARVTGKPIVLHVVQSHSEALATLRQEGPKWKGIVHSFAADRSIARQYLELGLALSISGRVTYPNATAVREAVRSCRAEALVYETDSPDQPPKGLAPGEEHTPISVRRVIEEVARLRGEPADVLAAASEATLERIFDWKPKA